MKKYNLIDSIHENNDFIEVVLRITRACNQKCIFCFVDLDSSIFYTFEEVKREINNLQYFNKRMEFVLTWWEPTINPDFIKIVDYLYSLNSYIRVQTNAVYFSNKNNVEKIKKYSSNIDFFVSFHSSNEKIYNFLTGSRWQFDLAIKWIKNLLEFKEVEINIVLTSLNTNNLRSYFYFLWNNFSNQSNKLFINFSILTNIYKYSYSHKILVSFTEIIKNINACKKIIEYFNIWIRPSFGAPWEIPFCVWKELFYFKENTFYLSKSLSDRTFLNKCQLCKFKNNCNWLLRLYIEKFWDSEIQPYL